MLHIGFCATLKVMLVMVFFFFHLAPSPALGMPTQIGLGAPQLTIRQLVIFSCLTQVLFLSKLGQPIVSWSSAEVEYPGLVVLTLKLQWLRYIPHDLSVDYSQSIPIHCDNQAAFHIAYNPVFNERTKHIELDCHFVREKIKAGLITPSFLHSHYQLADIFAKPLKAEAFRCILGKLGVLDIYTPAPTLRRGGGGGGGCRGVRCIEHPTHGVFSFLFLCISMYNNIFLLFNFQFFCLLVSYFYA